MKKLILFALIVILFAGCKKDSGTSKIKELDIEKLVALKGKSVEQVKTTYQANFIDETGTTFHGIQNYRQITVEKEYLTQFAFDLGSNGKEVVSIEVKTDQTTGNSDDINLAKNLSDRFNLIYSDKPYYAHVIVYPQIQIFTFTKRIDFLKYLSENKPKLYSTDESWSLDKGYVMLGLHAETSGTPYPFLYVAIF